MWAALQLQPLKPWPPNAISTTKPPPRRHSTAVLHRHNREKVGGFGGPVSTALNSTEPQRQNAAKSKTKTRPPPREKQEFDDKEQQRQLCGADVLMALERATAQKVKKKKDKRDVLGVSRSRNNGRRENKGTPDYINVRPLCIKPEWSDRLEELERRLEELTHI